ncbi:hypothetical protein [Tahibacter amnicola]|uniref:Cytochrome oxidase Cu insertion factor (SCO1/SenC/PrrC family) n=1 Tax=Tahibacter amnicola TaxID=2976241 RepID=A0ABY6BH55_9GAMM|nr:hypothetical protein [Tahibacter amnicola]UXI68653.1 hypothetical protein N4264_03100 [Tahibacter amnicola]
MNPQRRKRLQLIAVMLIFLAPMVVAFTLHLLDWQPGQTRNFGKLVQPPVDIADDPATVTGGQPYAWKDIEYRWTLVLIAGPGCAKNCQARLGEAEKLWSVMTQKARRLRLAAIQFPSDLRPADAKTRIQFVDSKAQALLGLAPAQLDSVVAAIVDPAGKLMLHYDANYDAAAVRQDLSKLIR